MDANLTHYIPIVTTIVAALFTVTLYQKWRSKPSARHTLWWMIGVAMYGVGTLTEALTTVFGWQEPVFRAWYISGALLGGAPLATGTVYLLFSRKTADRIATAMVAYVAIAAAFVLTTPIVQELVDPDRLSGQVIGWTWVRLLSPLINLYAVVFLVGGAILSAVRYRNQEGARSRVTGNWLIAIGAILPAIGGSFARAGVVEVLYVTELLGILTIWAGFRVIEGDGVASIWASQKRVAVEAKQ